MDLPDHDTWQPPAGFRKSRNRGPYSSHNGPYYHKVEGARFWHGLLILDRHCNVHGQLHGGMMTAFADGLLATAVSRSSGRRGVTINLNCQFVGQGRPGEWLQGTAQLTAISGDIAYARAEATAAERLVFNATGVFRLLLPKP